MIATTKRTPGLVGWSDSPNRSAPRGEEQEPEFEAVVADAIRGAYRADGAAEDTETFVEMGELGMFGVFVAARPKSVASFRMREIAQEAKELFECCLAEEMDAFEERASASAAVGGGDRGGADPIG